MKKLSPLLGVGWVPFKLRLRLARFSLWRLKHGRAVVQTLLLICLISGSAGAGYAVAIRGYWQSASAAASPRADSPLLASALVWDDPTESLRRQVMTTELGKLQAEIVRLRVLFLRLAKLAQLEDGEFDLDMTIEPSPSPAYMDESESFNETGSTLHPNSASQLGQKIDRWPTPALLLVKRALVHISEQAARMYSVFLDRRLAFDSRVSGLPVVAGHVSSRFGYRVDPLTGRRQLHGGLDLVSKPGSNILALADGIVTYSGKNGGYGNLVELEHPEGFRTRYAHNSRLLVPLGGRVKKGQVIATMGSSGRSTGTHVHVEVRVKGRPVDPQQYIR